MDQKGTGTIGIDDLLGPLVALGLAENKEQVRKMFEMVDTEDSG